MQSMTDAYIPNQWYWLADDGRVFAGAREAVVGNTDPDYVAWKDAGREPTVWPRDEAGAQTDASLQPVLHPHRMYANLEYYSASVRDAKLTGGITASSKPFDTSSTSVGALNTAAIATAGDTPADLSWRCPDGTFVILTKDEVLQLQGAVSKLGRDCLECEVTTLEGIDAGAITQRAQVDAAYAAIQTDFTGSVTFKVRREPGGKKAAKPVAKKK
jgi:hypothetical protein